MSRLGETHVDATPPQGVGPASPAADGGGPRPAWSAAGRVEDVARWTAITEAGGRPAWVDAELRLRGFDPTEDPSALDDAGKAAFKERRKAMIHARKELRRLAARSFRATHVAFVGPDVFFRDDLSAPPEEEAARLVRARQNDLAGLPDVAALAAGLGLTPPELRFLCAHRPTDRVSHYRTWTIPKRSGGERTITAPKQRLKAAQRWLLRNVVEKLPVHNAVHGFVPERSIVTNAQVHAGAELVVKVDLADFFPTVTLPRVKGLLRKAGLPEPVAILAALLATEAPRERVSFRGEVWHVATGPRALPQGAPTSPAITNVLCRRLDRRLSGLARALGFVYTRYADDLTFSWRSAGPPRQAPVGALLSGVRTIVGAEGFRVHPRKTRVMRTGGSQRVTGLVVNPLAPGQGGAPVRVPRDVLRRLRAALHNRKQGRPGREGESLDQLEGLAAFVFMVDPAKGRPLLDEIRALKLSS
jgi:RNA-directed DNA polymerase